MIITASTTPRLNIVCRKVEPPGVANNGIQPRWSASHLVRRHHVRHEVADAPEAVDDARDGGEQVDQVAERLGHPARGVVGDEQRDPDGQRGGDDEGERRPRRSVPKMSGPTYSRSVSRRGCRRRESAGTASTIRNTATPARTTRMRIPAPRTGRRRCWSPRLRTGAACGWRSGVCRRVMRALGRAGRGRPRRPDRGCGRGRGSRPASMPVDGCGDLRAQLVGHRRRAGGLGGRLLALRAD